MRIEGKDGVNTISGIIVVEFYDKNGEKIYEVMEGDYKKCVRVKVFECSVPLSRVAFDNTVRAAVKIIKHDIQEERYPAYGFYVIPLVSPEKIREDWIV